MYACTFISEKTYIKSFYFVIALLNLYFHYINYHFQNFFNDIFF